jgi:ABC-type transporter Mla MlaB component
VPDTLTITKIAGRVTVLQLAGKLDGQTNETLLETVRQEQAAGMHFLLLELQGLEMITSAGLGTLHNIYKMLTPREAIEAWEKEKHGEPYKSAYFKLAGAPPNVYYVLNIAGFLSNIPIYPDSQQALESFPR